MKCIINYFRRKRNQVLWVWVLFNGCWICPFIWSNCLLNLKNQHIPEAAMCACKTALFELKKHHLHSTATMDRILFPYRCCMQYFSSTFGFLYSYEWKMLFLLYIIISYMRVQLIFKWLLVAELCRQIVQHEYSLTIGKKKRIKLILRKELIEAVPTKELYLLLIQAVCPEGGWLLGWYSARQTFLCLGHVSGDPSSSSPV